MKGSGEEKNVFGDGNNLGTYAVAGKESDFVGFFGRRGGGGASTS